MIAGTVYDMVINTLNGNSTLNTYVKRVFRGLRNEITGDTMPCICVEAVSNNEVIRDMNEYKNVNLGLDIIAFCNSVGDPDKAIVGDENYKGILDIENDIRACLQASYSLGNNAIDIVFEESRFDYRNAFPIRTVTIPIKILYRQHTGY